jgi:hypothetical protein
MNYTVIDRDEALHIVNDESLPVYFLDQISLQKIVQTNDAICSGCIFHLASYGALPTSVLYQVASYIQKHFSYLNIDWFTTFYYVERNSYLTVAFRMKEMLEEKDQGYAHNRLQSFSAFEATELVEGIDSILLKIVMMNMINFKVKTI